MPKEKVLEFDHDWFDSHVIILGPDEDTEEAIKNKLKEQLVVDNEDQSVV